MAETTKQPSPYGVHPGVEKVAAWLDTLPATTGRSLDDWLQVIERSGPAGEDERRDWLKKEHGFGTNQASYLAERSCGKGVEDGDPRAYLAAAERWVDAMLAGPREALRPLYDELLALGLSYAGVRACPCQTIVPLYRRHVFAQIKPATRTRIDFGLALGDTPAAGRLLSTGGYEKKDRITHRIAVSRHEDIDTFLKEWLAVAYARDAR